MKIIFCSDSLSRHGGTGARGEHGPDAALVTAVWDQSPQLSEADPAASDQVDLTPLYTERERVTGPMKLTAE